MANFIVHSQQWVSVFGSGTVHSDGTTFSRGFTNYYHKGVILYINRTAESGTCTMDVKIQHKNPHGTGGSDGWTDLLDGAGSTGVISCVQYADSATGLRTVELYPGLTGGDADGVVTANTSFKKYTGYLPHFWRLAVTTGGTSVTNTFSIAALLLP